MKACTCGVGSAAQCAVHRAEWEIERTAQIQAHRASGGSAHEGDAKGPCVVCRETWPCSYAGPLPEPRRSPTWFELLRMLRNLLDYVSSSQPKDPNRTQRLYEEAASMVKRGEAR